MPARRPARVLATLTALVAVGGVAGAVVPTASAAAQPLPPGVPDEVAAIMDGDLTGYQWMLDAVRAPQAWTESTGAGVTVAVIDTGVDATAPDLAGQVVPGGEVTYDFATGEVSVRSVPLETTSEDTIGHGSHVAGIIVGDRDGSGITGIAPGAKVMPIAFGEQALLDPVGFFDGVAAAIEFAVANDADVINLSLGGVASHIADTKDTEPYLAALERTCDAVAAADAAGTVVVAAAGNDGAGLNTAEVPASCDGALSVAAVGPDLRTTYFSSFDATVQLAAPGLSVLSVASSAAKDLRGGHLEASGTSMAAPVVAGVAALVKAQHPLFSAADIRTTLTGSARDVAPDGRDPLSGFGLVDASAAVGAAAPPPAPMAQVSASAVYSAESGTESDGSREAVISWNPPQSEVTGYTVRLFDASGVTSIDVDRLQVRLTRHVQPETWVDVTAHVATGQTRSFPTQVQDLFGPSFNDARPPRLRHVNVRRTADALTVSWQPPTKNADRIDQIWVLASFRPRTLLSARIRVEGGAVPTSHRLKTPRWAKGHDCDEVVLVTVNKIPGVGYASTGVIAPGPFKAVRGMAIDDVVAAGGRAAEVSGSVPASRAREVCGSRTCAGRVVWVKVRYGETVTQTRTRLNARGEFHAVVWRPQGRAALSLRVVGPAGLASGGFETYRVRR